MMMLHRQTTEKAEQVVLIAEDNPGNMLTFRALLKDRYNLLEAEDGEKALKTAMNVLPDLILLDMSLPIYDGFEVTKKLKKDNKTKNIPIIAVTAHAMKGDKERVLASGCDEYISKPVDMKLLLQTIGKYLN
jgi:CheY-like chemotaxis protein